MPELSPVRLEEATGVVLIPRPPILPVDAVCLHGLTKATSNFAVFRDQIDQKFLLDLAARMGREVNWQVGDSAARATRGSPVRAGRSQRSIFQSRLVVGGAAERVERETCA
jgi:hypothetical protein